MYRGSSPDGVSRVESLENMFEVMLIAHVARQAEIVVKTLSALKAHPVDPLTTARVADYVRVFDTCTNRAKQLIKFNKITKEIK
jgi:hypothetical protein